MDSFEYWLRKIESRCRTRVQVYEDLNHPNAIHFRCVILACEDVRKNPRLLEDNESLIRPELGGDIWNFLIELRDSFADPGRV